MKKVLSALLLIALAVVACLIYTAYRTSDVSVRLKWQHQAQFAGLYMAEDLGYYAAEKLNVTLIEKDPSDPLVSKQVAQGLVDFGIVSLAEFMAALDNGDDLITIAATYQISPSAIVSLKSAGINVPQDLQGRTLGVMDNDRKSRLMPEALVRSVGVDPASINFVAVGNKQLDALLEGSVDAVAIYRNDAVYTLGKLGKDYTLILPEDHGAPLYGDILVTNRKLYYKEPDVVARFAQATLRGWNYALDHKTDAVEASLRRMSKDGADAAKEAFSLDVFESLMRPSGGQSLGQMSPNRWDEVYDLYYSAGLIKGFEIYTHFVPTYFFKQRDAG